MDPLRILLTSDLHLGMKFAAYPESVRAALVKARFECLERIVGLANDRRCNLLVIAGDLFHSVRTPQRDVERAAETLRALSGPLAAVMPGNHDYLGPGDDLWVRFRRASGDAVMLLEEARPYPLVPFGLDACLYPGPCLSLHSAANAIGWVRSAPRDGLIRHHIGVAHGSLEGVSPDFSRDYYPMMRAELSSLGISVWLLGHTHLPYPERPGSEDRIFNAGTPEPEDITCRHEGSAWMLELGAGGKVRASLAATGKYRFFNETAAVRSTGELAELERRLAALGPAALLRVRVTGRLPRAARGELSAVRGRLEGVLKNLEWDDGEVREEISAAEIDQEFAEGSFPHRLLQRLAGSGDAEALQIAYELLEEAAR